MSGQDASNQNVRADASNTNGSGALALSISVGQSEYHVGEPVVILATVTNKGAQSEFVTIPIGADVNHLLNYEVVELNSGAVWEAEEFSERSVVSEWRREVPPQGSFRLPPITLQFKSKDGPWQQSLPVGRYRILCYLNERAASRESNRTDRVFRASPIEVTVRNVIDDQK